MELALIAQVGNPGVKTCLLKNQQGVEFFRSQEPTNFLL